MLVRDARAVVTDWVRRHGRGLPGYRGAYRVGSIVDLADDEALPLGSDVDLMVAIDADVPKPGKFDYRGVLLEVSFVPWSALRRAEEDYHLAHGLRVDTIVDDPTGHLRLLQAQVACRFADPEAVRRRCAHATSRIVDMLTGIDAGAPLHEQAMGWLFGTGVTTHVLLVAALRNPTVRLRYLRVRELVTAAQYGQLLDLLGVTTLTRDQVAGQLSALERTFDATVPVARTTAHRFGSNISPAARPIAIDAAWALVHRGDHREAVFWILATFGHCHLILAGEAPDLHAELLPAFRRGLADLGIADHADMIRRGTEVIAYLPELGRVAETLTVQARPAIIR
jgi:hypothetical protein